jgi:phosphoribosylanthranilate isomerase
MTRRADVDVAVGLGAHYVGVIFAPGSRTVTPDAARELLRGVPSSVGRVGVFGPDLEPDAIAEIARDARLDVIQLHGDPDETAVGGARRSFAGRVWAVLRIRGDSLPAGASALFGAADAVVVDAYSLKALGGTGVSLPWGALRGAVDAIRGSRRLVLAGGLRPDNVAIAIQALRPDVVDVSSGVETAPGIKNEAKLRAFRDAVAGEVAPR